MQISLVIILLIAVAAIAVAVTLFVMKAARKKQADKIIKDAEQEGENIKKEKIFQAKEKFLQLKGERRARALHQREELPDSTVGE